MQTKSPNITATTGQRCPCKRCSRPPMRIAKELHRDKNLRVHVGNSELFAASRTAAESRGPATRISRIEATGRLREANSPLYEANNTTSNCEARTLPCAT